MSNTSKKPITIKSLAYEASEQALQAGESLLDFSYLDGGGALTTPKAMAKEIQYSIELTTFKDAREVWESQDWGADKALVKKIVAFVRQARKRWREAGATTDCLA